MKLALIGVGLIGGSLAAALRAARRVDSVSGFDCDPSALVEALRLGIIDRAAASIDEAVRGADLIVIATPVGVAGAVLRSVAPSLDVDAIITDVGSTKGSVIAAAREALGAKFPRFVPAHPIAGRELNGVVHASADLFEGKMLITTPLPETAAPALARVEELWRGLGARVERLGHQDHDRIFAAVSHLPHLLAFALVAQIAGEPDANRKFQHAGAGFRDFTRIAAASPAMWRDVCLANKQAVASELTSFRDTLAKLQQAIEAGDAAALELMFERASSARRRHASDFDSA
jgi:prephenate dehydrogenase